MPQMDIDALVAIDVHTHVHKSVRGEQPRTAGAGDMGEYFGIGSMPEYSLPELAEYYRERKMAAVAFGVDSVSQTGEEPVPSNEEVAELAAEHSDVIIPFASIDPARGAAGVRAARRLITEYGVRGFKFHPNTQAFYPNDRMAYPLYEVIAEHGLVALFHTGQTGVGAGQRAGGGIRLKYSNPLHVDGDEVIEVHGAVPPGHPGHRRPASLGICASAGSGCRNGNGLMPPPSTGSA